MSDRPERRAAQSRLAFLQAHRDDPAALEEELAGALVSLDWCGQAGEWPLVLQFREPLHYFLLTRAYWRESIRLNELAIQAAQALGDRRAEAEYTRLLADLYNQRGDYSRAVELYEQSRRQAEASSYTKLVAECWHMEAMIARARGDQRMAERLNERSLQQAQTLEDSRWQAHPLFVRALIERDLGHFELARQNCETSLSLLYPNEIEMAAQCHHLLADTYFEQGRPVQAQAEYEASLALSEQIGSQRRTATTLFRLGELAQAQGNEPLAAERYAKSIEAIREMDRPLIAKVLLAQATLAERQGKLADALRLTEEARGAFEQIGDQRYLAVIGWRLTRLAWHRKEWLRMVRVLWWGLPHWFYLIVKSRRLLFGQVRRYIRKARQR